MAESTEASITQPVAGEAQTESANAVHSANDNSGPQNVVPPNLVEIEQILKPVPAEEPVPPEEEEETEEAPEDDEYSSSGEEQMTVESTPTEQEQNTPTKEELLPSDTTYAAAREAFERGSLEETSALVQKAAEQRAAEERAAKRAEARAAEKQRATREDSASQEDEEDSYNEEPEPQPEPDCQFSVKIGGIPGKTAALSGMKDLIRVQGAIRSFRFVSTEDGVIDLFGTIFGLRTDLGSLYESLVLPTNVQSFRTTRELFDDIVALLQKHVMLPSKECSLLAYWSIATWFTDYLPLLPSLIIRGPASTADLLRTLVAVCHRPVLLGELSPTILRKLPITQMTPTLLIREPQLNRHTSALLNASNQPGYLFFDGQTFEQLYCPKCIYVGELFKDPPATSNSIQINLGESVLRSLHQLPTKEKITYFHNRLLAYRLLSHDKVATANFRVSGFRPELSVVAEALGAVIVDDVDLQRGIIEVLKDRDEQSRVDRASGVNGVVLRAVLFHCHQKDQQKIFVREIAATANRFYAEDGESLKVNNETVGHVLKYLGICSRRLGNAGRGLIFDKATQSHAHRLGHGYDVLTCEPGCTYCHELQQPQSEEVVHDV